MNKYSSILAAYVSVSVQVRALVSVKEQDVVRSLLLPVKFFYLFFFYTIICVRADEPNQPKKQEVERSLITVRDNLDFMILNYDVISLTPPNQPHLCHELLLEFQALYSNGKVDYM